MQSQHPSGIIQIVLLINSQLQVFTCLNALTRILEVVDLSVLLCDKTSQKEKPISNVETRTRISEGKTRKNLPNSHENFREREFRKYIFQAQLASMTFDLHNIIC